MREKPVLRLIIKTIFEDIPLYDIGNILMVFNSELIHGMVWFPCSYGLISPPNFTDGSLRFSNLL